MYSLSIYTDSKTCVWTVDSPLNLRHLVILRIGGQINLYYITHHINSPFKLLKLYFILILYVLFGNQSAYSEQIIPISNKFKVTFGTDLQGSLKTAGTDFEVKNQPYQNLDNQPTSAAAYSTDFFSAKLGVSWKDKISLHARADYLWQIPIQLGLYPTEQTPRTLILKDLYLKMQIPNFRTSIWFGRRTFEFAPIVLFQTPNPFDQINLQGLGLEFENFQIAASLNEGTVSTIATDQNQNLIVTPNGNVLLYPKTELIGTLFLSGKFLLSEGNLFEPIAAFRYYQGSPFSTTASGATIYKATQGSSFIIGGIFSRPISSGMSGTTTLWFESLPADEAINLSSVQNSNQFNGLGRIPESYPRNSIGISDSSEFYFNRIGGLLTALVFTNNTYSASLPVLQPSSDNMSLVPDGTLTSIHSNKFSIDVQPIFFLSRNWHLGADLNFNYVAPKLFSNDANALLLTPLIRYAIDKKLNSTEYFFISAGYGFYDWKIKTYSNGVQTNGMFSTQAGFHITL